MFLGRMGVLLAISLLSLGSAGCLTIGVIREARGTLPHEARIVAIRSAGTHGEDVVLRVALQAHGRKDIHEAFLRISVSQIGATPAAADGPAYEEGSLKLKPLTVGTLGPVDTQPSEPLSPLPIRRITLRDGTFLEKTLPELPPGVSLAAVRYSRKQKVPQIEDVGSSDLALDKTSSVVVVRRGAEGSARKQFIEKFGEQPRKRPGLLWWTPLTIVGDIVLAPIQLAGMLLGGG